MFFKVNPTGCNERKGLCEVRYDLYLDPSDPGYAEHYVNVPVVPKEGYQGKTDEFGEPLDMDDFNQWFSGLPKRWQHNPFCCHFCQFEPDVTDEEILYVGELALDMAAKNWAIGDLQKNKNLPVKFPSDEITKSLSIQRIDAILNTDFTTVEVESKTPYSVRK